VATDGNDSNPGTSEAPWRTIQHAVDNVDPGDTIIVRAGTYNGRVAINQSGERGNPITLRASGDVTVNGGSQPALWGRDADNWIVEGFTLRSNHEWTVQLSWDCAWGKSCDGVSYWELQDLMIYGQTFHYGHHLLMEGCESDGQSYSHEHGVYAANTHHNVYRNNEVYHFTHSGIREQGDNHDALIEYNHVHDIYGWGGVTLGIDLDGHGDSQYSHVIRGNLVENIEADCIILENAFNTVVEDNELHGCGTIGIEAIGYAAPACQENGGYGGDDCSNALFGNTIENNTIVGPGPWAALVSYGAGGLHYQDNSMSNVGSGAQFFGDPPGITWDGNTLNGNPYDFSDSYRD
jgi:nitrous oxidase accessory protein NosD